MRCCGDCCLQMSNRSGASSFQLLRPKKQCLLRSVREHGAIQQETITLNKKQSSPANLPKQILTIAQQILNFQECFYTKVLN